MSRSATLRPTLTLIATIIVALVHVAPVDAQSQPSPVGCDGLAPGDVGVVWTNNDTYSEIQILVDGTPVQFLAGTATSTIVTGLDLGSHSICVAAFDTSGALINPIECCDIEIEIEPIAEVLCSAVAGTTTAALSWTNLGPYTEVKVTLDGGLVSTLPGAPTSATVTALTPGSHTLCVYACWNGTPLLPSVCCNVFVSTPGGPDPIDGLVCDPTGPDSVSLDWNNHGPYDEIEVIVDGALLEVLSGSETTREILGLAPGVHEICVVGVIGGSHYGFPDCCTVDLGSGTGITDLLCEILPVYSAVQLTWTNNGPYTSIDMFLDGVLLQSISGFANNSLVSGFGPGPHTICLTPYIGANPAGPEVCCTFDLAGGVDPIDALICDVTPGTDNASLSWTNNSSYTAIDIELDGAVVATVNGSDTGYLLSGLAAGPHTVCVVPFDGPQGPILPAACCSFTIDDLAPIDLISCEPVAGTSDVAISWTNGGVYDAIEIELDGALVATLPGTATSTLLTGLAPGDPTICVLATVGAVPITPAACCQVFLPVTFIRGDYNTDGTFNIADGVSTLEFLFVAGPPTSCDDAADTNDDGTVNVADAIVTLAALFSGGPPPPAPHPDCGSDPTTDALGCASYPPCP